MKTRLLSGLLSLLGFSGIAASCNNEEYQSAGEYGTPYARFTFKGTVTDAEAHSPLEGIRVISRSAEAPELTDTVYTDRAGAYLMEFEHIFPNVEKVELRADAQERENGILFEEARHTIIITEEDYTGRGKAVHGTTALSRRAWISLWSAKNENDVPIIPVGAPVRAII
ncbi:MAG: radical SAM-associated putative lipoprotein [Alistipes inops]